MFDYFIKRNMNHVVLIKKYLSCESNEDLRSTKIITDLHDVDVKNSKTIKNQMLNGGNGA